MCIVSENLPLIICEGVIAIGFSEKEALWCDMKTHPGVFPRMKSDNLARILTIL